MHGAAEETSPGAVPPMRGPKCPAAVSLCAAHAKIQTANDTSGIAGQRLGAKDSPLMPPTPRHISYGARSVQLSSTTVLCPAAQQSKSVLAQFHRFLNAGDKISCSLYVLRPKVLPQVASRSEDFYFAVRCWKLFFDTFYFHTLLLLSLFTILYRSGIYSSSLALIPSAFNAKHGFRTLPVIYVPVTI